MLAMNLQTKLATRGAASLLTFFASELAPASQRPILVFVSNPQRLNTMKLTAMVISKLSPVCARAALLTAAVMNMMLLPADAAVPALFENSNMAAEMAAGRTRVTARALISIGMSRVMVVIAS